MTGAATIASAVARAAARLAAAGSDTPRLDAEVLMRHVLGIERTAYFLRLRDELPPAEAVRFEDLVAGRESRIPVAYLTGEREFMNRPFAVGPGVLIPRPETELMVEWAMAWLAPRPGSRVVDVGTGSGAVVLSLAAGLASARGDRFVGVDVSPVALGYAARNREHFGLGDRVQLVRGDLLGSLKGPVDLVLANLPYLRPHQLRDNPDLTAEPALALVAGNDGLAAIRRLLDQLPGILDPRGAAMLELDPTQAPAVAVAANERLPGASVRVSPDLAGLARFVVVEHTSTS